MDFASIVLFLSMYYLRPQEWAGALNKLHPMWIAMAMAVFSLFNRERGLRLRDIWRTPHDWMMTAYFAWIVLTSADRYGTFKDILNVIVFYIVIVQTLTDVARIKRFLAWWAVMIMAIVVLALAGEYGFDPFGSYDLTHGMEKGRLSLNLSIFNNPNGLAHSVVPVIPMIYFLLFWKRLFMKASVLLLALPLWCIYLTQSKGAYLCGFATILMTLTFGRPKIVQVLILSLAVAFGSAALYTLPRMGELKKARNEAGIQGRLAAYSFGLQSMRSHRFGLGYKRFVDEFFAHGPLRPKDEHPERRQINGKLVTKPIRMEHYQKAPHGSYNEHGAELGWGGLYLFVGVLYCCLRTVVMAKTANVEEERVRRILFVLLVSYAVSSWMVDFAYRTTFFMFTAAISAFHWHMRRPELQGKKDEEEITGPLELPYPVPKPAFAALPAFASVPQIEMAAAQRELAPRASSPAPIDAPADIRDEEETSPPPPVFTWKRLGLLDLALIYACTWGVVKYWAYIIKHI